MSIVSITSVYDSPMSIACSSRLPMREAMRDGIRRAYAMRAEVRLRARHDLGLEVPVVFATPGDYAIVASRSAATHIAVCTEPGGECILYFVPSDRGSEFECLVASGDMLRNFVASYLVHRYVRLAFDPESGAWRNDLPIDAGFHTLHCDADGEFAGSSIDGPRITTSRGYVDTCSALRLDVAGAAPHELTDEELLVSSQELSLFVRTFEAAQRATVFAEAA